MFSIYFNLQPKKTAFLKGFIWVVAIRKCGNFKEERGFLVAWRWKDAEAGTFHSGALLNAEKLKGDEPPFVKEYHDYYRTLRDFHERSLNSTGAWNATNALSFMNMPILTYIKEISPRPLLIIVGENAHSRYFSEDAYKLASEPKELVIIPNAVHVDLYDKLDKIPFGKLEIFFKEHLK